MKITGYTDSKGSANYNLELSKKRARAVEQDLARRLDRSVTFKVAGKGEANPVAPNTKNGQDNPKGRKRNRRVEISYERTTQQPDTSPTPTTPTGATPTSTEVGKEISGTEPYTKGLRIQVTGLRRLSHGALLSFIVGNTTSEGVDLDQWTKTPDDYADGYVSEYQGEQAYWVNLEDSSRTRYWVVADTTSHCLCTIGLEELEPGDTQRTWALLSAPPEDTDTVDVHFSGYETIKDVPVSG